MNSIEELIQRLCPQGVTFTYIGEVCFKTRNIQWKDQENKEFQYIDLSSVNRDNGNIIQTSTINSSNAPSRAQQIIHVDDVIFGTTRPTLKRCAIIPLKYDNQICSTGFCVLRTNKDVLVPKYLYYILNAKDFIKFVEVNQEGASYPAIADSKIKKFTFPLPPIEIQNEIVSILDKFTLLEAELEAELEARKTQYTYYRNNVSSPYFSASVS